MGFKLNASFLSFLKRKYQDPFKNNGLGNFVYRRTYSRPMIDGKSHEDMLDTVIRVVEGMIDMQWDHFKNKGLQHLIDEGLSQSRAQEMAECFLEFKALPPGRGLWAMGSPLTREKKLHAALNNCAFVSTNDMHTNDPIQPFLFLMDMSMMGVGTGFDTKGAGSVVIPHTLNVSTMEHVIGDSREGWVMALQVLLEYYFKNGPCPRFDFSQVRPAGLPIKGFGGISGGPEPLKEMLDLVADVLDKGKGQPITVTAIVDIMNLIGKCIVSGNVRRTAEIAFGDADDDAFLDLKDYKLNPHRMEFGWTSNNSVFAQVGRTDYERIMERTWRTGEPGLVWLDNKRAYSRMKDPIDFRDIKAAGTNPCLTGDTLITTTEGPKRMDSLIGKPFKVLFRNRVYSSTAEGVFETGHHEVLTVSTFEGPKLRLTVNHKVLVVDGDRHVWRAAGKLKPGDHVLFNNNREVAGWEGRSTYEEGFDFGRNPHLVLRLKHVLEGLTTTSYEFHKGFITSLLISQNSTVLVQPTALTFTSGELAAATQGMLTNMGVRSFLTTSDMPCFDAQGKALPNSSVRVHNDDVLMLANKLDMPTLSSGNPRTDANTNFYLQVSDIDFTPDVYEPVYDCNIDDKQHAFSANGIVVHNCVEQTLESYELCNLGETFPFNHTDLKDYLHTLELMHLYTKTVTLGETNWERSNRIISRNRRIGISMSGIFQFIHYRGYDELEKWCNQGYDHLKMCDRALSHQWRVDESIKLTSVKPSGTVSLLAGATPGIHAPIDTQYIRRVRFPTNSSWAKPLREAGYKVEKAHDGHNTSVVEFPINLGNDLRCQHDQTAHEQLANAAFMQRHWADNSVSCTISFDPEEESPQSLANLLKTFDSQLKGISFLPTPKRNPIQYAQPPYERISVQRYHELVKNIKPIVFEQKDKFIPKEHAFCDGDKCVL